MFLMKEIIKKFCHIIITNLKYSNIIKNMSLNTKLLLQEFHIKLCFSNYYCKIDISLDLFFK